MTKIPVLTGISFIIFCMLEITPGDPAQLMSAADAAEEQIRTLRDEFGLNDPFWVRYSRYRPGRTLAGIFLFL